MCVEQPTPIWLFGNSEQPLFDLLLFLLSLLLFCEKKEQAIYEMDVWERVASA